MERRKMESGEDGSARSRHRGVIQRAEGCLIVAAPGTCTSRVSGGRECKEYISSGQLAVFSGRTSNEDGVGSEVNLQAMIAMLLCSTTEAQHPHSRRRHH